MRGAWTKISKCEYSRTSSFLLPTALPIYIIDTIDYVETAHMHASAQISQCSYLHSRNTVGVG